MDKHHFTSPKVFGDSIILFPIVFVVITKMQPASGPDAAERCYWMKCVTWQTMSQPAAL